jgi:hypothetical protein
MTVYVENAKKRLDEYLIKIDNDGCQGLYEDIYHITKRVMSSGANLNIFEQCLFDLLKSFDHHTFEWSKPDLEYREYCEKIMEQIGECKKYSKPRCGFNIAQIVKIPLTENATLCTLAQVAYNVAQYDVALKNSECQRNYGYRDREAKRFSIYTFMNANNIIKLNAQFEKGTFLRIHNSLVTLCAEFDINFHREMN